MRPTTTKLLLRQFLPARCTAPFVLVATDDTAEAVGGAPRGAGSKSTTTLSTVANIRRVRRMALLPPFTRTLETSAAAVSEAYAGYFGHVSFRNGWRTPAFDREAVRPLFDEAARYVVYIRAYLDETSRTTKLRQLDGSAQTFLHSEAAKKAFETPKKREFVEGLVLATFQDAMGYVEGLNREVVLSCMREVHLYSHNPKWHAANILGHIEEEISRIPLSYESPAEMPTKGCVTMDPSDYCTEETSGRWRSAIMKLYTALDAFKEITNK